MHFKSYTMAKTISSTAKWLEAFVMSDVMKFVVIPRDILEYQNTPLVPLDQLCFQIFLHLQEMSPVPWRKRYSLHIGKLLSFQCSDDPGHLSQLDGLHPAPRLPHLGLPGTKTLMWFERVLSHMSVSASDWVAWMRLRPLLPTKFWQNNVNML